MAISAPDQDIEAIKFRFTPFKILAFLAGIFILLGLFLSFRNSGEPERGIIIEEAISVTPTKGKVKIDVSGAVENPGVYELAADSRVVDALKAAGGLSALADREFISKYLSLAIKVSDGDKVYIPRKGETVSGGGLNAAVAAVPVLGAKTSYISLNRAGEPELDTLPGVGPVTAQKIISGRPYQNIEDLVVKKIVSKSVFEKIKEKISL